MKVVFSALLILVTHVRLARAQSPDLWDRLAELRISEDIELVDMSQHRTRARFAGYSKDAILVGEAGRPTSVPRANVCMVNRLETTNRGRKIWLYPLVGASAGASMGALGWSEADATGSRNLLRNFTWIGAVTGLSLGATSRSEPVRFAIYQGN